MMRVMNFGRTALRLRTEFASCRPCWPKRKGRPMLLGDEGGADGWLSAGSAIADDGGVRYAEGGGHLQRDLIDADMSGARPAKRIGLSLPAPSRNWQRKGLVIRAGGWDGAASAVGTAGVTGPRPLKYKWIISPESAGLAGV